VVFRNYLALVTIETWKISKSAAQVVVGSPTIKIAGNVLAEIFLMLLIQSGNALAAKRNGSIPNV
jgi:hypothetical protein